ncbi:MAG: hypothetical protein V4543_15965 [Bacteroidota bacterium]
MTPNNPQRKLRITKTAVFGTATGILLVLNLLLLGLGWSIWRHHGPPGPLGGRFGGRFGGKHDGGGPHGKGDMPGYISHELALSNEQQTKYLELREAQMTKISALKDSIQSVRSNMFSNPDDTLKQQQDLASLSALHLGIEKTSLAHYRQLYALCTPEQKTKLQSMVGELTRDFGRPGPGGRGKNHRRFKDGPDEPDGPEGGPDDREFHKHGRHGHDGKMDMEDSAMHPHKMEYRKGRHGHRNKHHHEGDSGRHHRKQRKNKHRFDEEGVQ